MPFLSGHMPLVIGSQAHLSFLSENVGVIVVM
jgi:hypothetical protein